MIARPGTIEARALLQGAPIVGETQTKVWAMFS